MNDYRFNTDTEPTEEQLHVIMQEAALDAKLRWEAAQNAYFDEIERHIAAKGYA